MFVRLDLGWMDHPFPLSSFRISTARQIEQIQALGVPTVQWEPQSSDAIFADAVATGAAPEAAAADSRPRTLELPADPEARALVRREGLKRQRELARACERHYGEAASALKGAFDRVFADPARARAQAESVTAGLMDKMLSEEQACIRMLNSASGDRSGAHALNVAVLSMLLGRALGLDRRAMLDVGIGALMHDVGKMDLPASAWHDHEHLSAEELRLYRDHVSFGVAHARRMGLSDGALAVVMQHHETSDGKGFPRGVGLERMSVPSRIVALVNRFDNLCNPAVLAGAMTPHEALSYLFTRGRAWFDPELVAVFVRQMGVYPAGSVVQLSDERYAMVVSANPARPLRPRLLVYDPDVPADEALHLELDQAPEVGIRRSLRPAMLPPDAKAYLSPRPRVSYFFESSSFGELDSAQEAVA